MTRNDRFPLLNGSPANGGISLGTEGTQQSTTRANGCPTTGQLWPVAVDETPAGSVAEHLEDCQSCRDRVSQMVHEIDVARSLADGHDQEESLLASDGSWFSGFDRRQEGSDATSEERRLCDQFSEMLTRPLAVIGKYFVLETLRVSGQSSVFRGFHPSLLKDVVIKLAHQPCMHDQKGRARLVTEARALAEIDHPHLARLYDLDFQADRPFLVLEYVRGTRLGDHRDGAAMSPSEIAFLMAKVARAVSAAHEQGVLHLDLKPDNILVTTEGEPVLIDFGLSILRRSVASQGSDRFCIAGTPEYMSPEQARGLPDKLDVRTDVFGIGAVLYDLFVGHPPFAFDRDLQEECVAPTCEPDWTALDRASVPRLLSAICRKAMATDPRDRFDTVSQMAERLEAVGKHLERRKFFCNRLTLSAVFTMGILSLLVACSIPVPAKPEQASLQIQVVKATGSVPLQQALPISGGDAVSVQGTIGETAHVGLLALIEGQTCQWLGPLATTTEPNHTRLAFPDFSNAIPLSEEGGTLLILLLSRRDRPLLESDLLEIPWDLSALPDLPTDLAIVLSREQTEVIAPDGRSIEGGDTAELQKQLESLKQSLRETFDDFIGILIEVKPNPVPLVQVGERPTSTSFHQEIARLVDRDQRPESGSQHGLHSVSLLVSESSNHRQ